MKTDAGTPPMPQNLGSSKASEKQQKVPKGNWNILTSQSFQIKENQAWHASQASERMFFRTASEKTKKVTETS